ncbi:hypothetical protein HDV02_002608 [Globomyces sp. JEL0801]|nr:hypothetical protein HDV02_002608 [Globomyces sp. JEL0801]
MSSDFLLPFAILNCGIGLSRCDYEKLATGKIVPWLALGALASAFMYLLAGVYVYMYQITAENVAVYRLISVVQNVNDMVTTICLEYCYIIRLAAFITNTRLRQVLFFYTPFLLFIYSSCVIVGILLAFNYPISDSLYQATYNAGNLSLSLTNFVSHFFLCRSLMAHLTSTNAKESAWTVYLPVITTIGLGISSICGLRISTLGTGLVYWWWTLDILSFFTVNNLIMKYLKLDSTGGKSTGIPQGSGNVKTSNPVEIHSRK